MSGLSDLENMKNTVTEETSYTDSDTSVVNDIENNTTLRKTHIHTYILSQPPKIPLFNVLSDNENLVALPSPKFIGSKKLHSVRSHVSEKCIFDPVKSFVLDIKFFVLPGKTIGDKLIAVKKMFYWIDSFKEASALSKLPGIIRALLYILSIGTTAHDLASYDERTCFIGCNPVSYAHNRCAVVCFDSEKLRNDAIGSLLVFRGVNLRWAGLFLVCCAKCDQFGHVSDDCSVGRNSGAHGKWVVIS
ncbi:hypothetical protein G9A89_012480 [Geosiphon pyriformis]|nr:hypothetical protein G9A89_012480 [Geosiphon pyriformis]